MLQRSLILLSLLFAAQAQAGNVMHASPNGSEGCPAPGVEASASEEPASAAEPSAAASESSNTGATSSSKATSAPILRWRSFLPGMIK